MGRQLFRQTMIAAAISSLGMSAAWGDDVGDNVGRTDGYGWQEQGSDYYVTDVVPAATSDVTETIYRSILNPAGNKTAKIQGSNVTTNYKVSTKTYSNSPSDSQYNNYGPSIYNVQGDWPYKSRIDYGITLEVGPIWLDAYKWESGYIYQNVNQDYPNKDEHGAYGYGFVPGVINVTNQGCARIGKICSDSPYALGGPITATLTGSTNGNGRSQINVSGSVGYSQDKAVPNVMSTSLPWTAAGASLSLTSTGGRTNRIGDWAAGDGGQVKVGVSGYRFTVGSGTKLASSAIAPFTAINAVSRGGGAWEIPLLPFPNFSGGWPEGSLFFPSSTTMFGQGGLAKVSFSDSTITSYNGTEFMMGIVAASVGGSTQYAPTGSMSYAHLPTPGFGGDAIVEVVNGSAIHLPFNNSIGVVATSTGDQTIELEENTVVWATGGKDGFDNGTPGSVTVELQKGTSVLVGDKSLATGSAKSAGDTNIGVLANSSSNWGRELFTGDDLYFFIPGPAGDVTVENAADVTAYGPNAVGVLAQSIGGKSISSSGGTAVGGVSPNVTPYKDTTFSDSDGGSVTYTSQSVNGTYGGSITAAGDGATGLLLQSIGGGGGAGGNATGLFVAVGDQGGNGGNGGTLTVTLKDQNVTTTGDYAKGVIGHSIGGGGGNGGHATAYGLLLAVGVGGAGGGGGDGGKVTYTGTNASVTTNGQHAMGLTFQSIGAGGGTGGGSQNYAAGVGFTFQTAVGGSGGKGGSGGDLSVTIDEDSSVLTSGVDSHGVLLHSVSGGGGAGGTAAGATFNIGQIPDVPVKINVSVSVGGSAGNSDTGGNLNITNKGTITTKGAGSYGLVMQSIGGGGGHGADSTAGANSWGGAKPPADLTTAVSVAGSAGTGADGGSVTLTSSGTISTQGHNAIGLLAQSIGGGGGVGGTGNAYETERWVGDSKAEKSSFSFAVGATAGVGSGGGAGGDGGKIDVTITPDKSTGFTTIGAGSSAVTLQSIGGSGGVGGDAGTQGINGQNVDVLVGGGGGSGGSGGEVDLTFAGNIQTGGVAQLVYTDSNNEQQTSSPVTVGGSSHGILAQSIGGGGGSAGNASPSTSLVPKLTDKIVTWKPTKKQLKIKNGIEYWAKRATDDGSTGASSSSSSDPDYTATVNVGGSGGSGADGGKVNLEITDRSDITVYGHHSYGILGQSIGGGGGIAAAASSKSLISGTVDVGKKDSASLTVSVGGSGSSAGDGGEVEITVKNPLSNSYQAPNNAAPGNYIRTGGYASHAIFGQSIGGGGGVGHEGSIIGFSKIQGKSTPKATLGHTDAGGVKAGNGGDVYVGTKNTPIYGWIETAGDASTLLFAQSVGGGGGTISFGCTTNSRNGNDIVKPSPCYTDATPTSTWDGDPTTAQTQAFTNPAQVFDLAANGAGGDGGDVHVYLGDSHVVTDGDRSIGIVAQSIGGGGGYISADAQNVGSITQSSPSSSVSSTAGDVSVELVGGNGRNAYLATYGDGAWGILAQSIAGGGGLLGDTALNINGVPKTATTTKAASSLSGQVQVDIYANSIVKTEGKNSHGVVMQSWSGGGGIFAGSGQNPKASLVMGEKSGGTAARGGYSETDENANKLGLVVHSGSTIEVNGEQSIAVLAQSNVVPIFVNVVGTVQGGKTTASSTSTDGTNGLPGTGVMISGGGTHVDNRIDVQKDGKLTTYNDSTIGYAIRTDNGTTNVTNAGTIIGSVDLGSTPGTFTNESGGVLKKGPVYKVGDNSLHNYGTINIGNEDSVSTTNLEGRIVQYDSGRTLVTFDVLGEQSNDRLIVDGTAVLGGSFETRAKSLLPGDYEFLTATDLTVTADAADRLLYAWDATVTDSNVTVTPTRTFRTEGLSLSPTSQNLVSYLERAWDNADAHHASLFGYKHELEAVGDYNSLLETLGGQALNAQPLQMRMSVLSNLGDSMACPVVTPNGLSLGEDRCVWAKLTGEVSDLSSSDNNLGYRSTGGGLRVGTQQTLGQGWTVGAAAGYALNDLTATDFSSNGQMFDLSLSAKRDVGQWSFGGSLGYAHGWFDNNRSVSLAPTGASPGFDRQYDSNSSLSIYSAKLRAAYTFEHDAHYIRPYVDFDVAYSQAPGFSESGQGDLALQTQSNNQWNVGISPMVEYGADFVTEGKTRMMFFVSAGATFLPNNQQTTPTSFVGAQAANGTFDVVTDGPNVLGRLNLGMQVYEQEGYEVRAQYGLQAGEDYWSQSVSINAVFRF